MAVNNTLDYGMWKETGPNLHSVLQKSDSVDAYSLAMRPLRSMILNSVNQCFSTLFCQLPYKLPLPTFYNPVPLQAASVPPGMSSRKFAVSFSYLLTAHGP